MIWGQTTRLALKESFNLGQVIRYLQGCLFRGWGHSYPTSGVMLRTLHFPHVSFTHPKLLISLTYPIRIFIHKFLYTNQNLVTKSTRNYFCLSVNIHIFRHKFLYINQNLVTKSRRSRFFGLPVNIRIFTHKFLYINQNLVHLVYFLPPAIFLPTTTTYWYV